ncbi:MAG TPA: hypothetical protein IAC93_05885 [Candidatus Limisoma gallistercoris]|nr:hypothetical protein [Candidatus Limisoma gallistercoris]
MLTFITYAIILFFIEVAYIAIARRFNIIATTTNKISESRQPIITGGGILFFIATVIFFIFKNDGDRYFISMPWTVFAALAMLTVVSFIDDMRELSPHIRLACHIIAVAVMFFALTALSSQMDVEWYWFPLFLFFGVAFINAYNFMDGITGITGCYSFTTLFSLFFMFFPTALISPWYFIIPAIATAVFCAFNCRKHEVCFSGDAGSISMAYIILFPLAVWALYFKDISIVTLVSVYLVDAGMTIILRLFRRENLLQRHHNHIYQLLVYRCRWNQILVAAIYSILQFAITLGYVYTPAGRRDIYCLVAFIALAAIYLASRAVILRVTKAVNE